jgi:hypothetical protein
MAFDGIGMARKFATRVLAAGALLALYSLGTASVTGGLLTATVSPAEAQDRGRARGHRARSHRARGHRGRALGRGRARGRGHRVCRHVRGTSRRACRWVR